MIKPFYESKYGTLYNCDCIEFFKEFEEFKADMILTDIPYGEVNRKSNGLRNLDKSNADLETFDLEDFIHKITIINSGSIYCFCGTEQVSFIRKYLAENGLSTRVCAWEKTNPSPMNGQHLWLSGIEFCVYGKSKNATFNEFCKNSIWRFPSGRSNIHPTQKPLELFSYLIQVSTNKNDVVFDPCMGSGTTALASESLCRKWVGCELDEEYCEIISNRLVMEDYIPCKICDRNSKNNLFNL